MTKTLITDAMVRRFARKWCEHIEDKNFGASWLSSVREALEAALNPPPEPEIVVTDEMKRAGCAAWKGVWPTAKDYDDLGSAGHATLEEVYRAMHAARPKETVGLRYNGFDTTWMHHRKTDVVREHRSHRRKDDR